MKKNLFLFSILAMFSTCGLTRGLSLQAQDTIYPYAPDYPFFNDTIYGVQDSSWRPYIYPGCADIMPVEHTDVPAQTMVSGLAIPYSFGTKPMRYNGLPWPNYPDTISIRGVIVQIDSDDYEHPTIFYTNPIVWNYNETPHVRPYDCHIAFVNSPASCKRDTVVEAYSLYFNTPVVVGGSVFVGIARRREKAIDSSYYNLINLDEGLMTPVWHNKCSSLYPNLRRLVYILRSENPYYEQDSTGCKYNYPSQYGAVCFQYISPIYSVGTTWAFGSTICPIVTMPDTDSFGCPAVEGFAYAGMFAESPTFVWDTAEEHDYYQIAYGAYNLPVHRLQRDTTSRNFIELFGLSPDIYYQARVRARCHHQCPVHDTVMWTAWSAPIYFYTGDHMPDTTHQQEGVAVPEEALPFVIVPNPSRTGARQVVEIGRQVPLQGLTLTLHDAAGHEVLRMEVKEHSFALPVQGLPAGVYMATLASPQGTTVKKLAIEN